MLHLVVLHTNTYRLSKQRQFMCVCLCVCDWEIKIFRAHKQLFYWKTAWIYDCFIHCEVNVSQGKVGFYLVKKAGVLCLKWGHGVKELIAESIWQLRWCANRMCCPLNWCKQVQHCHQIWAHFNNNKVQISALNYHRYHTRIPFHIHGLGHTHSNYSDTFTRLHSKERANTHSLQRGEAIYGAWQQQHTLSDTHQTAPPQNPKHKLRRNRLS